MLGKHVQFLPSFVTLTIFSSDSKLTLRKSSPRKELNTRVKTRFLSL